MQESWHHEPKRFRYPVLSRRNKDKCRFRKENFRTLIRIKDIKGKKNEKSRRFQERRKHIANLSDEELYNRFWELTEQVVEPLLDLGRKNTTPSVERAVLLRMGVSSLDTQKIVEGCMDRGLMGPELAMSYTNYQREEHLHQRSK